MDFLVQSLDILNTNLRRPKGAPLGYFHGNYCGPNYSAGKFQPSVADSPVPAVDAFDETCKRHDAAYARGEDLRQADLRFFRENIGRSRKRTLAAMAVGLQGLLRKKNQRSL